MKIKKKYFFIVSGEHHTLPISEINAILETYSIYSKKKFLYNSTYAIEAEGQITAQILNRLTMTKRVCEFLFSTKNITDLKENIKSYSFDFLKNKSFRITIKKKKVDINSQELSNDLGDFIKTKYDATVNLTNPDIELVVLFTDEILIGKTIFKQKNKFSDRKPQDKPYFIPGTIKTKISRVLINLARIKEGERLLDPFCGCGGFIIEAGLMKIDIVGYDIDPKIVEYAKSNLKHYGVSKYDVKVGDATKIQEKDIDAIVCDPPYGLSTKKHIDNLNTLYSLSINNLTHSLKKNRYFVIVSPDKIRLEELGKKADLKLIEMHQDRVHKSLTRKICVFQKRD